MPSLVYTNAITASGRDVPFAILHHVIRDLYRTHDLTNLEFYNMNYWIGEYESAGPMPGTRRFRSPFSNDRVLFTQLLDDLYEMFLLATNWEDLTDEEEEAENIDPLMPIEVQLFRAYPIDIGRFAMFPRFDWIN